MLFLTNTGSEKCVQYVHGCLNQKQQYMFLTGAAGLKKTFPEAHRHTEPPRALGTALQQTVEQSTVPQQHLNTRCHKEEEGGRDSGERNENCKGGAEE